MTQPIAPQRPGHRARTTLQTALGFVLLASLASPLWAQTTETEPVTSVTTDEWRYQQRLAAGEAPEAATQAWRQERKQPTPETGNATRGWLQAQSSREQASTHRPTLSGPAMRRVHDRYLKSFEVEIPQQLRESLPSNK